MKSTQKGQRTTLIVQWIGQVKGFLHWFTKALMTQQVSLFMSGQATSLQIYLNIFFLLIVHHLEEIVAIKCIDMKQIKDSISKQMLQCEIEALKTLKHPNILQCYDVIQQISHCYIITQFCNEGDLSGILKKKRKLCQNQATQILKYIVNGFVQLANKGFLHRDLKLANIFMSNGKAKLADFGFAKKIKNQSIKQKYNVGSPLYMSPEALKSNCYSLKSDIWSIGIMGYELLHGQTPWECRSQQQLIQKITSLPVKFRQSLQLSTQIKLFLKKCLQVDERKRMSLNQLKEWLQCGSNLCEERFTLPSKLNLVRKPITDNNPLCEVTNYPQPRTHRALSNNPYTKQNKQNKNRQCHQLSKQIVDYNNTIIVNQINTFRLLYKIGDKLKKVDIGEQELLSNINREVLKRVNNLKRTIQGKQTCLQLQISQPYLDASKNPSIIKYQSVITDYFNKYNKELSTTVNNEKSIDIIQAIKKYLKKRNSIKSSQQVMMTYWMIEYTKIPKVFKRAYLQQIIDPKTNPTKEYIEFKIKQIL